MFMFGYYGVINQPTPLPPVGVESFLNIHRLACLFLFQEVDVMIADITAKLDQQVTNVNQFLTEMKKFDEIQSQLDAAKERISGLDTSCSELEDKLVLLEDVYGEMQQNNNKFEHEYQLRKYRERKHLELEQVKGECH